MSKKKIIAVFDKNGQYLSHCTFDRAIRIVKSNKGYFVGKYMIRLRTSKLKSIIEGQEIIKESHRICYICKEYIPESETATIDHVIPRSRDPQADTKFNKKCCCLRCNTDKDNRLLSEYVTHIKENRDKYKYISDKRLTYLEEFAEMHEKEFNGLLKKYLNAKGDLL